MKNNDAMQSRFSSKFPILQQIFDELTDRGKKRVGENLLFTHSAIERAYRAHGKPRPTSSSNFVLDLTRRNRGIEKRLPSTIIELGYDLRHTTGPAETMGNYAGEFVFVGVGNTLHDWLEWPSTPDKTITLAASDILKKIFPFLRRDEAALFSVLEYTDALSHAIHNKPQTVFRVQCPVKWQPNEIDGLYFSDSSQQVELFPIEAKALSTADDIYLPQIFGAYRLMRDYFAEIKVVPLGIRMTRDGFYIARFREASSHDSIEPESFIHAQIDPPVPSWQTKPNLRRRANHKFAQSRKLPIMSDISDIK